jgi:hypothetical protein
MKSSPPSSADLHVPVERNALVTLLDEAAFGAHAREAGWTDGLPVVPPTPERVQAMVAASGADELDVLGIMPPANGVVTVHAAAANAVMAGCRPAHFRVLLAALRAMLDPAFNLEGIQATTSPVTPAVMVSGPVVEEVGFNAGHNCLGPGNESNAVVGRAVRLCLLNLGGAEPGRSDMATQGQPGKYTFCFAENQAANPWDPHHVERGFAHDASCVTVFQAGMVTNLIDFGSKTAESLLRGFALAMAGTNTNNMQLGGGDLALVVCPEHAATLVGDGFSKQQVQRFLHQNAVTPARAFAPGILACVRDWRVETYKAIGPDTPIAVVDDWRDINVVVAGGAAGAQSCFVPGFGDGTSVCVEIQ